MTCFPRPSPKLLHGPSKGIIGILFAAVFLFMHTPAKSATPLPFLGVTLELVKPGEGWRIISFPLFLGPGGSLKDLAGLWYFSQGELKKDLLGHGRNGNLAVRLVLNRAAETKITDVLRALWQICQAMPTHKSTTIYLEVYQLPLRVKPAGTPL